MGKTKIPYLDYSWSPLAMRCTPCSPGCAYCWHLRMANRLEGVNKLPKAERLAYGGVGPPRMTHRLEDPLKIKKSSRIGVQFMGDLFHRSIPWEFLISIFEIMATAGRHEYFILTKRPKKMKEFFQNCEDYDPTEWPNIWLGVTVCNQEEADDKIPILLNTPAAHRWVSYEPALGPVDLREISTAKISCAAGCKLSDCLYWVVAGSETGPGARPADNAWFRVVRDACIAAGVPYFQKATTGPIPKDLEIFESAI